MIKPTANMNNYKAIVRIPTKEPFAFIEIQTEGIASMLDLTALKDIYDKATDLMNSPSEGTESLLKDLISIVKANLVMTDIERYEAFSPLKKELLKEIKNLLARAVDKYKK